MIIQEFDKLSFIDLNKKEVYRNVFLVAFHPSFEYQPFDKTEVSAYATAAYDAYMIVKNKIDLDGSYAATLCVEDFYLVLKHLTNLYIACYNKLDGNMLYGTIVSSDSDFIIKEHHRELFARALYLIDTKNLYRHSIILHGVLEPIDPPTAHAEVFSNIEYLHLNVSTLLQSCSYNGSYYHEATRRIERTVATLVDILNDYYRNVYV